MEAYTSMNIQFKNNKAAQDGTEVVKKVLRSNAADEIEKRYAEMLINEMNITEDEISVDNCCCFDSSEFDDNMFSIIKALANTYKDEDFEFESNYSSCNCGYECFIDAEYENGTLTIKSVGGESFYGWCEECGGLEIYFEDYDPSKTYICPDCGRILKEEDLFPDGVPTWETETIKIK